MYSLSLQIEGMTCGHCVGSVRRTLAAVPGLHVQRVDIGAAEVHVDATTAGIESTIRSALIDAGYDLAAIRATGAAR